MEANKSFTPRVNGFFVPEARMDQILNDLDMKIEELEK